MLYMQGRLGLVTMGVPEQQQWGDVSNSSSGYN